MILEWDKDTNKYQFKTIYKLTTSIIDIEILWDDVDEKVTSGLIIVSGLLFRNITNETNAKGVVFHELPLEEAKSLLMLKTMEAADFISLNPHYSELPHREVMQTFSDLTDTFISHKIQLIIPGVIEKLVHINKEQYRNVSEFELLFRHKKPIKATIPSQEERQLRANLIREESEEFWDERSKFSDFSKADMPTKIATCAEACDLKYVTFTVLYSYGFDFDNVLHEYYYRYIDHLVREHNTGLAQLIINSANTMIYLLEAKPEDPLFIKDQAHRILAYLDYFLEARFKNKHSHVFAEIHRANMSKGVNGVIEARNDGKILKGPNYLPPNFSLIFFPQGKSS